MHRTDLPQRKIKKKLYTSRSRVFCWSFCFQPFLLFPSIIRHLVGVVSAAFPVLLSPPFQLQYVSSLLARQRSLRRRLRFITVRYTHASQTRVLCSRVKLNKTVRLRGRTHLCYRARVSTPCEIGQCVCTYVHLHEPASSGCVNSENKAVVQRPARPERVERARRES